MCFGNLDKRAFSGLFGSPALPRQARKYSWTIKTRATDNYESRICNSYKNERVYSRNARRYGAKHGCYTRPPRKSAIPRRPAESFTYTAYAANTIAVNIQRISYRTDRWIFFQFRRRDRIRVINARIAGNPPCYPPEKVRKNKKKERERETAEKGRKIK